MRNLLIILGTILIIGTKGCGDKSPNGYINHTVELKNNIGQLTIALHQQIDTTYSWTNFSDNGCDHLEIYRLANKDYSLLKENGFIYTVQPDSLYQLTISQNKELGCPDADFKIDEDFLNYMADKERSMDPRMTFEKQELRTINNRKYAILLYESILLKHQKNKVLKAYTKVDGELVLLEFVCYSSNCNDFVDSMEKSLKTIEIK
jgi:hypothetical protein